MSDWDALQKEARQLENSIENKLVSFSKLGSNFNRSSFSQTLGDADDNSSSRMFETMALELQELLMKLSAVNDEMADRIGNDPSSSQVYKLTRHRDILSEYSQEFNKTRNNIRTNRERAELLSSVQKDISSYRDSEARRQELYLKEHESIASSSRLAGDAIGIAVGAKDALFAQRETFTNISSRVSTLFNRFPVLNNVMTKIGVRKRRDALILGAVIAVCIIITLLYILP
eukprot:m.136983 g.136983  ORF g.136983 m.136983 type:complete len:230 (-) comp23974_c0_seq10:1524-2213(-)